MSQAARALDRIFRAESGAVLATLIRLLGDFQLAEDALQDALTAALETWPKSGLPASPAAWLATAARRKALDRLRHIKIVEAKSGTLALIEQLEQEGQHKHDAPELSPVPDDQLRLIFTCCHPALSREAQVALTLRTLGGLSVTEIARAFFVSDAALAQRLARAKQKIPRAKIPYEIPGREALAPRVDAVLGVLYLVFNEGYLATTGRQLVRGDLVADADAYAALAASKGMRITHVIDTHLHAIIARAAPVPSKCNFGCLPATTPCTMARPSNSAPSKRCSETATKSTSLQWLRKSPRATDPVRYRP